MKHSDFKRIAKLGFVLARQKRHYVFKHSETGATVVTSKTGERNALKNFWSELHKIGETVERPQNQQLSRI